MADEIPEISEEDARDATDRIASALQTEFMRNQVLAKVSYDIGFVLFALKKTFTPHIKINVPIGEDLIRVANIVKRIGAVEYAPGYFKFPGETLPGRPPGRRDLEMQIRIIPWPDEDDTQETGGNGSQSNAAFEHELIAKISTFEKRVKSTLKAHGIRGTVGFVESGTLNKDRQSGIDWSFSEFADLKFFFVFDVLVPEEADIERAGKALRAFGPSGTTAKQASSESEDFTLLEIAIDLSASFELPVGCMLRVDSTEYLEYRRRIERERHEAATQVAKDETVAGIRRAERGAPRFEPVRGRLHYREAAARKAIAERKKIVRERFEDLNRLCDLRANEQPQAKALVERYGRALKALRQDRGAYKLLLSGLEIESLVRIKGRAPVDPDRNPAIDADMLHAIDALVVAHAGLMALFPDVEAATRELDEYRQHAESLDALHNRVLDPALTLLNRTEELLDFETALVTQQVIELGTLEGTPDNPIPTRGEIAVKHRWLRGVMTAIGTRVVQQTKAVAKAARDAFVKEGVSALIKNSDKLTGTMLHLLQEGRAQFVALAQNLPSAFGWIQSLYEFLEKLVH